jgi:hypothetical protein
MKKHLTLKEFKEKVRKILDRQPMIGATVQEEIKWKIHEIRILNEFI